MSRRIVDLLAPRFASRKSADAQLPPQVDPAALRFSNTTTPIADVYVFRTTAQSATLACLAGLSRTIGDAPCRVTVIGPPDDARFPIEGLRDIRSDRASSCFSDFRAAVGDIRGEFVVLLADDLWARDGWVASLRETFSRFSDAAAITALVVDAAGKVESGGATIDWHARLVPDRAGRSVESVTADGVVPVASASAGFIAVRAADWEELAADLDVDAPLSSALVSISLLLAEKGRTTYLHPFAVFDRVKPAVKTAELADTAWADARRRYLVRTRFERHFLREAEDGIALPRSRPKVVLVDAFVPKPDQDSGSVDAFWYIRIFIAWGFQVTFVAAFENQSERRYSNSLRRWGVGVRLADCESLGAIVSEEARDACLVIASRGFVAADVIKPIRTAAPQAKIVFNTVDLHFVREERAAVHEQDAEALDEAVTTKLMELNAIRAADATIVVSIAEEDVVRRIAPGANLHRIPVPRVPRASGTSFEDRSGVLFIGGFEHKPNVDAVMFLANDIWPLVRSRLPDIRLKIVGSNVTNEVTALGKADNGIDVIGFVEDLEVAFDAVRLSVAPLRFGAGIKGKVVSSLIHGLPCVVSKIASEGMSLVAGRDVLEGETAGDLADAIVRLHEDPDLWQQLSKAGFSAACSEYSVHRVAQMIADLLTSLGLADRLRPLKSDAFDAH